MVSAGGGRRRHGDCPDAQGTARDVGHRRLRFVEVSGAGMFQPRQKWPRCAWRGGPLDSLSLVGVLQGPLFGVSDRGLFMPTVGGRFELTAPVAAGER